MEFMYRGARLPGCRELLEAVDAAAARVREKLVSAGADGPRMDDQYRRRYYGGNLSDIGRKLKNCSYHVLGAAAEAGKPLDQITLIDHGGGLGLIGLLAKAAGIGTVIYNDIDPKFLEAARGIARTAGAEADQYILGDVEALVDQLGDTPVDVLVSYDVIEHIYDLDSFFAKLCAARCRPRVLFMSSGANMFNARFVWSVIPIQRDRELLNAAARVAIIRECDPDLLEREVARLCRITRLCVRREIEEAVARFRETRKMEAPAKSGANAYDPFRTNTVDPETGWWAEHLFNPYYLVRQLSRHRFKGRIRPGYYGGRGSMLNPVIRMIPGRLALTIAPFYTVTAKSLDAATQARGNHS